ncbi:CDGSH iron-sulfur domain-containing protein 3, mitochondrial-like [Hydractinia symbiolongicarpus]|uniref:CDGSH iron-sulfur domain-containing protein 3, mitochondrial-like n=1 Tax=Hydractinia symbiolongicarpus TaxID=13093 RepID=UPI00254F09B7|nr:CDGSH iron-sulfur domain-containing protein 3, mitochondrial-like [Hydractinia symbiolongicarpus]
MMKPAIVLRGISMMHLRCFSLSLQSSDKIPTVAAKEPFLSSVVQGKRYSWCSCGLSSKQPFCDGSHRKTELRPVRFKAEETSDVYLCGCKQTSTAPYCDGTHISENVQKCKIGEKLS